MRSTRFIWLASCAVAVGCSSPASTSIEKADRFDLLCNGTKDFAGANGNRTAKYQIRYRLHLAQRRWCEGDCTKVNEIKRADDRHLILHEYSLHIPGSERREETNIIDRVTGEHRAFIEHYPDGNSDDLKLTRWLGQCAKVPYTGSDALDAKF